MLFFEQEDNTQVNNELDSIRKYIIVTSLFKVRSELLNSNFTFDGKNKLIEVLNNVINFSDQLSTQTLFMLLNDITNHINQLVDQ